MHLYEIDEENKCDEEKDQDERTSNGKRIYRKIAAYTVRWIRRNANGEKNEPTMARQNA